MARVADRVLSSKVRAGLLIAPLLLLLACASEPLPPNTSRVVAIGDSDTYGPGSFTASYPGQLQKLLQERGHKVRVYNEGVSGNITTQILSRLDSAVPADTKVAIVAAGVNDIKASRPPAAIKATLNEIVDRLLARGTKVVLVTGLVPSSPPMPVNYDTEGYRRLFQELGHQKGIPVYNFRSMVPLRGVVSSDYYAPDGLHLSEKGNAIVAGGLAPVVERLLPPKQE